MEEKKALPVLSLLMQLTRFADTLLYQGTVWHALWKLWKKAPHAVNVADSQLDFMANCQPYAPPASPKALPLPFFIVAVHLCSQVIFLTVPVSRNRKAMHELRFLPP